MNDFVHPSEDSFSNIEVDSFGTVEEIGVTVENNLTSQKGKTGPCHSEKNMSINHRKSISLLITDCLNVINLNHPVRKFYFP